MTKTRTKATTPRPLTVNPPRVTDPEARLADLEDRVRDLEIGISRAAAILLNWLPGPIAAEMAKEVLVAAKMRENGRLRIGMAKAV